MNTQLFEGEPIRLDFTDKLEIVKSSPQYGAYRNDHSNLRIESQLRVH